jgi:hypothetical protein
MNVDSLLAKQTELEALRTRVKELETEIAAEELAQSREVSRDYPAYHATAGLLVGIIGSMASLLFNVIGSLIVGKNPLELIRVYLTFPLGERALQLSSQGAGGAHAVGDGMIIALGCCLYLGTGMLLGAPIALALSRLDPKASVFARLLVGTIAALVIWGVNFYAVLAWLQPALCGGRWIVDNHLLPWWVAAATHIVFGWTVALLYPIVRPVPAEPTEPAEPQPGV